MILSLLFAQTVETRSRAWVWVVGVGLLLALGIGVVIARAVLKSLPDDVQTPVRAAVKQHAPPLGIGLLLLIGTAVFALWSAGLPTITSTGDNAATEVAAAGEQNSTTDETLAPSADGSTSATVAGGGNTATTARRQGVSLGAPSLSSVKDANLFTGATNTRGITNDLIKVCGHAALSLGAVLNTKPEDLLVFWKYINDKGGVFGRKFDVTLEDDQYTAEGGVPAAQRCAERNPFMIFGALGSDVLPPVRIWAEQNKELYLYGFTIKKGSETLRYSYATAISTEDLTLVMADQTVKAFAGKKIGLLWRNTSTIQPARDAYKKYVQSKGMAVVADLPVQKSQGSYTNEIITLQQRGAQAVTILDDAVSQLNIIKQAKTQQYSPNWLVFPFNIQTQTLGRDSLTPPIIGPNLAPAYECHTFDGPYAQYTAEIREFEAAYAKYSPNTDLCGIAGDIAWGGWLGFKGMATLFEACGPSCNRNHFAGLMESGYKTPMGAGCPVDFSGDGHHGGYYADILEAYQGPRGRPALRTMQRCVRARRGVGVGLVEQALVVGVITGGIYGLYALGLVLVYRGSGVLNFAQAELGTFTLFLAWCQGNCILVKFPSGNFLLYDAGSTSSATDPNAIADTITKLTGGKDIGTIILSHPDDDHINIIPFIKEAKNPKYLHISGAINAYDKVLGIWLASLPSTTDTVTYTTNYWKNAPSTKIDDNSANLDVYVLAANVAGDPNTQSIVISIDFDTVPVMLTGDATAVTERWILAKWPNNVLKATLLSFGHHGSNHSSSSQFLDAVEPDVGVFSASAQHMGYGHPRCSLVDYVEGMVDVNGGNNVTIPMHRIDCWKNNGYVTENNDLGVFLTATQGNILFRTDGTNYAVYVNRLK